MGDGRDQTAAPGRSSAAGADNEGAADAGRGPQAVGKQTLTEQLPGTGPSPVAGGPGTPPPAPTAKKTPVIPGTIIGGGPLTDEGGGRCMYQPTC